jgi:hypothetical protein
VKILMMVLIAAALSACTSQQVIESLKVDAKNDCATQSATQSDYTACMERGDIANRQYEQHRKESEDQRR